MKNIFLFLSLIPAFIVAQTPNSLLWKVSKDGSKHTSYLFGTMHTNDSLLNTFDQTWHKAVKSCDMLAGEINMTDPNELMSMMTAGMMKDSVLKDFYTEDEFKRVQKFINANVDAMTAMIITKMKPFYIMAAIMEAPSEDSPYKMVMDMRLMDMAKKNNVKVVGLETSKEQAASIDVISLREQAKMLLEYVDSGETTDKEMELMEKNYYEQNLDALLASQKDFDAPEVLLRSIIDGRNQRFAEHLLPNLETNNVFCAVGALHLPGETGLIASLKKAGYRVEPVPFQFGE